MAWEEVKLKEVTSFIKRGISPKYVEENGYKIINQKCINFNTINYEHIKFIDKSQTVTKEKYLKNGDILVNSTGTGTLGRTVQIKEINESIFCDTHVTIVRSNDRINQNFLGIQLKIYEPLIENLGKGSTNQIELSASDLSQLKINLPPLETQQKIVNLISNYDDLIENNNKRIKLLEQTAEELYKEWFVRLRFPNYQNTKIEDGIPERWEKEKLENYLEFFRGKSYSSTDIESDEGLPFVNLKCINRNGGFRKDGLKVFNGKYKNENIAFSGDIMMAVTDMTQDRAIVGRVGRIPKMGFEKFIFSMDLIRIEPINIDKTFLYSLLKFSNIGSYLKEFANGVNVLHLTPSILYSVDSLIPNDELQKRFSDLINPILEKIDILEQKNQTLKETRDLLLPRLLSGKLDIEKLDIN